MGAEKLQLRVWGPLRVEGPTAQAVERPSHRRLLAILALEASEPLTTEALIDRFWPDHPPTTARATIHTHVSAIRRLLGPDIIVTDADTYRLNTSVVDVDSDDFLGFATQAHEASSRGDWHESLTLCEAALQLRRGRPFDELRDDEFARPTLVSLEEAELDMLETRAAALVEVGRPSDALAEVERLVIEHPLRERLWECLMLARYRVGRYTEALRAFREMTEQLAEAGLEPSDRTRQLEERILLRDRSLISTQHNLPAALNEFIGRDNEIGTATRMILTHRLVTFTGAGGSGKTRLAAEVASGMLDDFPNGVWFVELAAITDPALVPTEIALAMNLTPRGSDPIDMMLGVLAGGPTLIVLDNCEHLLAGSAATAQQLLQGSGELTILATSREPLRIAGEALFEIDGLGLADLSAGTDTVSRSDAIRLLEHRARLVDPSFAMDARSLVHAAGICRRLDRMPLALELVAARTRTMSLQAIEERLDDQLALLTAGETAATLRHRTLESAIDWSYQMLSAAEQTALNRLSVFQGGFELDAAEHVISDRELGKPLIAQVVADLVDKSLVATYRTGSGLRYRLLETVRQYALLRLQRADDEAETRRGHLAWCLGLLDDLWERALGPEQADLIRTLEADGDNIQAALTWSHELEHSERARGVLQSALGWRWYFEGHLDNAVTNLRAALANHDAPSDRALVHTLTACCLFYAEDVDKGADHANRAHALTAEVGSVRARAWIINTVFLGHLMSAEADPATMLPLADEAADIAVTSDDIYARMLAEQALADAYCWNGRTTEGLVHQRAAIDHARRTSDSLAIDRIYGASIYNFMLDPSARRTEPIRIVDDWRSRVPLSDDSWRSAATDWLPWVYLQFGDFERADEAADRMGTRTLGTHSLPCRKSFPHHINGLPFFPFLDHCPSLQDLSRC